MSNIHRGPMPLKDLVSPTELADLLRVGTVEEVADELGCTEAAITSHAIEWGIPLPGAEPEGPLVESHEEQVTIWMDTVPIIRRRRRERQEMPRGVPIEQTLPEDELVRRIADGQTYEEIADKMGLSRAGVAGYASRIDAQHRAKQLERQRIEDQEADTFDDPDNLPDGFHLEDVRDDDLDAKLQQFEEWERAQGSEPREDELDEEAREQLEDLLAEMDQYPAPRPFVAVSSTVTARQAQKILAGLQQLLGALEGDEVQVEVSVRRVG